MYTCGFAPSFALMQKKQKIKDNPIAPRVCPGLRHRNPVLICKVFSWDSYWFLYLNRKGAGCKQKNKGYPPKCFRDLRICPG
jgi:hypothetical protein